MTTAEFTHALDKPFHRYELGVDIPATEVAVLKDALDGDDVHLRDRIGRDELERQLAEQRIVIAATPAERWPDFERDFETLSTYLSEPIVAQELHAEPVGPARRAWRHEVLLGRRGSGDASPSRSRGTTRSRPSSITASTWRPPSAGGAICRPGCRRR